MKLAFESHLSRFSVACLGVCLAQLCSVAAAQIHVSPFVLKTSYGPVRGFVASVDLSDPKIEICVTAPINANPTTQPSTAAVNAQLVPVDKWATQNDLSLAINANYFGWVPGGAHIIGLAVDHGTVASPPRSWKNQPDPAIVFSKDTAGFVARMIGQGQPLVDMAGVRYAVAGVGGSNNDNVSGTLLVQAGKNCGSTARVSRNQRVARTAAGIDASGHQLTLIVVDGRQPDWSIGMTLPELADLMITHRVRDAVNFDGGGSTSLVYRAHHSDPFTVNRPCDESAAGEPGVFRPVACQLGFRLWPARAGS